MELVLDRVGSSIEKYNWIMKRVQEVDVSADADSALPVFTKPIMPSWNSISMTRR